MCCMVIGKTFSFLYHIRGILNNAEMNAGVTQSKMMVSDKCKTTQNYPCNTIGQFQPSLPFHTHTWVPQSDLKFKSPVLHGQRMYWKDRA